MTETTAYADRYLAAVSRALPGAARAEILAELEASLAEQVEPRIAGGESRDEAERHVVAELGEPIAYASSLIDRPMWIVGPRYYAAWLRLLRLLLIIVPVCAVGATVLGRLIVGASVGEVIGSVVAVLLGVIVHVCFWTTLVFFLLERTGSTGDTILNWSPDQLPKPAEVRSGRPDLIASLVMVAFFAGLLLWDRLRGFVPGDAPLPLLNPELWPWGIGAVFLLLAAEAALAIAVYTRRRWTPALAVANAVIAVCFAALALTALAQGVLFNPEFVDVVFTENGVGADVLAVLAVLTGVVIVGIAISDVVDGWLKVRRARLVG
ncbi:permease prefix domain 1-containing protein [Microbacterium sp. NPDC058342]|uniref:permease prefix domain 1-containing protein n=1 Tax=Microbacterium sp. NPDC058342 TaxID=3346454 RepID=UPI00364C4D85